MQVHRKGKEQQDQGKTSAKSCQAHADKGSQLKSQQAHGHEEADSQGGIPGHRESKQEPVANEDTHGAGKHPPASDVNFMHQITIIESHVRYLFTDHCRT